METDIDQGSTYRELRGSGGGVANESKEGGSSELHVVWVWSVTITLYGTRIELWALIALAMDESRSNRSKEALKVQHRQQPKAEPVLKDSKCWTPSSAMATFLAGVNVD